MFNSTAQLRDLVLDFQNLLGQPAEVTPERQSAAQRREKVRALVDDWLNGLVGMTVDVP